jgi:phosphoserine phosphatase
MSYRIVGIDVHKKMLAVIESWRWRSEERLSGRRTACEAPGCPGAHRELCARPRAAALADRDATQVLSVAAEKVRARKMIRELRTLGYRVELRPPPSSSPA